MAVIGARPSSRIGVFGRRARPPAPAAERPRVRHAGAGRRVRQISIAGSLASIAIAAGLALFYLSQSSHVAAVGYEIDNLQGRINSLLADRQQLRLEAGAAQNPSAVLERARELGLVPIDSRNVTFASPSTDPKH